MSRNIFIAAFLAMFLVSAAISIAEDNTEQQLRQRRARQLNQLKQDAPIQQKRNAAPARPASAIQKDAPVTDAPQGPRLGQQGQARGQGFGQQQGRRMGLGQGQMRGRGMAQQDQPQRGQVMARQQNPAQETANANQPRFNPERIRNAMQKARQSGDEEQIKRIGQHIQKMRSQLKQQAEKGSQQRPIMQQKSKGQQGPWAQAFGQQKGQMQGRGRATQGRQQRPMMQQKGRGQRGPCAQAFGQQGPRRGQGGPMAQGFGPGMGQMQGRRMGQRFGQGRPGPGLQTPPFGFNPFGF